MREANLYTIGEMAQRRYADFEFTFQFSKSGNFTLTAFLAIRILFADILIIMLDKCIFKNFTQIQISL